MESNPLKANRLEEDLWICIEAGFANSGFCAEARFSSRHDAACRVFTNAPGVVVTNVLSEGESRALSLAAFLTELSTATNSSAIIFDDLVSSLDHIWREPIARRLVVEAKNRSSSSGTIFCSCGSFLMNPAAWMFSATTNTSTEMARLAFVPPTFRGSL